MRSITFSLDNPKILLFTIPVGEYLIQWNTRVQAADGSLSNTTSEMLIAGFYSNVLNMLERHDVLRKTIGVGLIITKWDKAEAEGFTSVEQFVETKCATLHETILDLQTRNGNQYAYKVFSYSISDNIDEATNSYELTPQGNDEIYEWLTNTAYQAD